MAEGTRLQTMDAKLTQHEEILTGLTTGQQTLQQTHRGIQRTLELIQDRLTTLERRPAPVPDVEYDGTGCCVRSIDCKCNICIRNESLNYDECCVCSIDCKCDICIENDATSPENKGLNYDETEINRPSDFHVLDDPQVELDSFVLGCTRELDLPSVCFNNWLECGEFKTTRVACYLFDKMFERGHVQVVHVFIRIKSNFSLSLVGNGLIVPIWDPGIGLKTVKVWDTGWQWFMHRSIVHIDSVCSYAIMPTYSSVYSGKGDLSAFHILEDLKGEFDSFVLVGIREHYMPGSNRVYGNSMIYGNVILPGILLYVSYETGINFLRTTCSESMCPLGQSILHQCSFDPGPSVLTSTASNSLLGVYFQNKEKHYAVTLFETTPHKIVVSCKVIISCCTRDLWCHEVVNVLFGYLGGIHTKTTEIQMNWRNMDNEWHNYGVKSEESAFGYHYNSCLVGCSRVRCHSQTHEDFDLCSECFNSSKFKVDMFRPDFIFVELVEEEQTRNDSWKVPRECTTATTVDGNIYFEIAPLLESFLDVVYGSPINEYSTIEENSTLLGVIEINIASDVHGTSKFHKLEDGFRRNDEFVTDSKWSMALKESRFIWEINHFLEEIEISEVEHYSNQQNLDPTIKIATKELIVSLRSTFESFLQHDAQALHHCLCERVGKLMRVEFSQIPYDPGGSIIKYYTLVEKVAGRLFSKLCQLSSLFDFIFTVAMCSAALNCYGKLEDGKVTWIQETQRELLVNWSTKSEVELGIFSIETSFFPIWSRAYGNKFSSTDVHAIIIPLLVEKLYLAGIIMTFVLAELLTMEGYSGLVRTISAIIQLENSFMLAYTTVEYSTLTNGYKEVMSLVGLMKALENVEVAKCQFGMVPSFHQID